MLLDVAERHGLPVDLHIDETLDPAARWFDHLVEATRLRGIGGRVVASHACSLSALTDEDARRSIEAAAAAGVAVCTLRAANLFLPPKRPCAERSEVSLAAGSSPMSGAGHRRHASSRLEVSIDPVGDRFVTVPHLELASRDTCKGGSHARTMLAVVVATL